MFIHPHSGVALGSTHASLLTGYRHLLINFSLLVVELEAGDFSRQYDPSDWKEYFCVLEREPPAIRICLDEQVSRPMVYSLLDCSRIRLGFGWLWSRRIE